MQEWDDNTALRAYVTEGSETAFAALVTRHINKVYSVAWRHTRNPHSAEEITQAVFVILARKARELGPEVILSGWLYQTARWTALTHIRSEIRRNRREQEASMQSTNETTPELWSRLAPLLDPAMAGLREKDRQALVLRFFDGRSVREVGSVLRVSEDTAKKRVARALEKLRRAFAKRGVVLPAITLAGTLASNSVQAAPPLLASSVNVISSPPAATTLAQGTLQAMAWVKAKALLGTGAIGVLVANITMRELDLPGTLYLSFGLVLCLLMPLMLSVAALWDAALRKACLRRVWIGQWILAAAGLVILFSEAAAPYALAFGTVAYLGCAYGLWCKLRTATRVGICQIS